MAAPHEIPWSKERCGVCVEILRSASSYREGLEEIVRYFKRPVSGAALRNAFARYGLEPPAAHVGKPASHARTTDPAPPPSVDLADLDYDEDDGNAPTIANGDVPPSAVGGVPVSGPRVDVVRDEAEAAQPAACRLFVDHKPEPSPWVQQSLQTWFVFSDCHIPFEDPVAYEMALRVCRWLRPYGIALIGDFADLLSVSSHPKAPQEMRWQLKDEVERVRERRAEIDAIGATRKVLTTGNHEVRGQRRAMEHFIGLYDSLDPDSLFEFTANGWEVHSYQQHVRIGKVNLVHDLDYCGIGTVRQNAALAHASVMCGHSHAAEMRYFGNAFGEHFVSCSIGWLGDASAAKYMAPLKKRASWQHAFAVLQIEESTQNTHVQIVPVIDGRCVVNGRLFDAREAAAA